MKNNLVNITLLCGFKRAGKDTVADVLSKHYDYTHYKISTPLKETLKILFNFNDSQLEGDLKDVVDPKINKTPRDVMKYVGTNMFQHQIQELIPNIGRNFWIDTLLDRITSRHFSIESMQNIVVSDLRFTHECNAFRYFVQQHPDRVRVNVVKILRNNSPRYYNVDKHESEIDHLNFSYNYVIENNASVESLIEKTNKLHSQIQADVVNDLSSNRINMII